MKGDKQKTLVVLIPGFPANEEDSTCLPMQQSFLLTLKKLYPQIAIAVISFQYPFRSDEYTWNEIPVIALNGRNRKGFKRLIVWIRAWRKLNRLRNEREIIGLLSFWCTECALVGKWFSRTKHIPHFCWVMGQDARKENRFVKLISPSSNELIALSDFLVREFQHNHGRKPFLVVPTVINRSDFPDTDHNREIDVIGVGSLIPLKQYDLFVSAINAATKINPRLKAVICGKGPEQERLLELIKQNGLEKNLELLGEKSHEDVLILLQHSRVLLHTSNYEGFGTVCLEALYAGAHVISFVQPMDVAIPHWHIVTDVDSMIKKLVELLADPRLNHQPILPYPIENAAHTIMQLFLHKQ